MVGFSFLGGGIPGVRLYKRFMYGFCLPLHTVHVYIFLSVNEVALCSTTWFYLDVAVLFFNPAGLQLFYDRSRPIRSILVMAGSLTL
ncbi:uncharacterized protein BP01DRAFT_217280 [Aspergillus saccharolyticus JOP 1030-1]|uniref:Uncharacterized protein n=1 Tax=Aspergillus saccharolyticus JOP 1030-1 TaxID=1450539 RepID=A0A319ALQ4_9EURO|nr:hypothetical protein BP01DRAFT_217280 [Aspergillus saccharolyticus JOP 1030-1]PYH47502.1 hypothetical protein BP01DRAFT_217280 [Aspergillus saccharolyticus JOP 1030-1]